MTANILPNMKQFIYQPFNAKVLQAQGIIAKNIRSVHPSKQAIGFSGGKDSTLVARMVLDAARSFIYDWDQISVVFENTGVEYPETLKFIKKVEKDWGISVIELKPEKNFWQCVKEMGRYPIGKSKHKIGIDTCCDWLKERPMKKAIKEYGFEILYDGITAMESRNRMIRGVIDGTCHYTESWKIKKVHPILYLKEDEVWKLTKLMGLPINPIYAKGADRCGCMTCTAHKGWQDELSKTNPKMLKKILRDMGQNQLVNV